MADEYQEHEEQDEEFVVEDGDEEEVQALSDEEAEARREAALAGKEGDEQEVSRRQQKKRERLDLRQEAERLRMEREQTQQQLRQQQELIQQLAMRQPQQQQAPAPQQQEDPDAELRQVYSEIQQVYDLFNHKRQAGKLTNEEAGQLERKLQDLDIKKGRLLAKSALPAQPQVDQRQQAQQLLQMAFQQESQRRFPDIHSSPQALRFANGEFQRLTALGHPDSPETHVQAMTEARKRFFGGQSPNGTQPPTQRRKGAYQSVPNGARGGGKQPLTVKMDKRMKEMAEAARPDLPPKKAHQEWVRKNGKGFIEDERRAGRM